MTEPPDPATGTGPEPVPPPAAAPPARRGWLRSLGRAVPYLPAAAPAAIVVAVAVTLLLASGFHNFGWDFFGLKFNSNQGVWGVGVLIVGSFLTAVPALVLSMLLGLGIAIASTTYLPRALARVLDPTVDLLAGIPSVVYGIWAFVAVAPWFGRVLNPWLASHLAFVPGFAANSISPSSEGVGLPIAIFVLTLMALPITTLLIRDALRSVPRDLWESGLALGATRWEVVRRVALRHGRRGVWSAAFLGFGRAIGETVAVAMVIGAVDKLPSNAYDSTWTMAAFMFQELDAAFGSSRYLELLAELGLVLLAITFAVNLIGRRLVAHLYAEEVAGL